MKFVAVVLLAVSLPAPAPVAEIDAFVAARMRGHLIPALALVVIREGEVVHRRGFGSLDPDRPVLIGSLSKALTATAILQLVDAGKIELEAPMQRYLGNAMFRDPRVASITVRHLLHQTSGLPTEAPRAASRDATLAEHVEALKDTTLVAAPGERHIYSSPNYQILGRIVERVSGQSFGDYLSSRIFAPLGMTASAVDPAAAPRLAPGHNLWWGFAGPSSYRFERGRLPTASIISSADDLGRFARSQLGLGPQLLTSASQALAHQGAAPADGFSYAMGWRAGTTAGVPSLWHGGSLPSYRGAVVLLPSSRSAIVVLTNASSQFADHTREIAAGIVALLEQRPLPEGFRPLRTTYAIIAGVSLLLVALQLRSLMRAARHTGKVPGRLTVLLFDLALPLAAVLLVPRLMGVSYRGIWEATPDLVATFALLLVLGVATGIFKLRRALAPQTPALG